MGLITVVYARARCDFVWVNRDLPRLLSFSLSLSLRSSSLPPLTTLPPRRTIAYRVIAFSGRKCPLSTFKPALCSCLRLDPLRLTGSLGVISLLQHRVGFITDIVL